MVDRPIELVAALAGRDAVTLDDVRAELGEEADAKKALFRLGRLGLAFRIAQGRYAVPDKVGLSDALALGRPPLRLAAWLHRWLGEESHRAGLALGLDWERAGFAGLALDRWSDLRWQGPDLLVPIQADAARIQGLHHSVAVLAYDPAGEPHGVEVRTVPALLPAPDDLARVLLVHHDPRLREAGRRLHREEGSGDEGSRGEDFDVLLARTDPPQPFPDARLARGPPFRYRVFAPRSWVRRDREHARLDRGRPGEGT